MAQQHLERPGQAAGRRLVAGDNQRHHLVADVGIAQRPPVRIARRNCHGQDVTAHFEQRIRAARGDLGVDQLVERRPVAQEAPPRAEAPEVYPQTWHQHRHAAAQLDDVGESRRELLALWAAADAEDDSQHDLHRYPPDPAPQRDHLAETQGAKLGCGGFCDLVAIVREVRVVELRREQRTPRRVLLAGEQERRAGAYEGFQDGVGARRLELIAGRREELLDQRGVTYPHCRVKRRTERQFEHVTVAIPAALEEPERIALHRDRPQRAEKARSRGQRHRRPPALAACARKTPVSVWLLMQFISRTPAEW